MDADHMARRRASRERDADIYIEPIPGDVADYEDEVTLNVSHNGYQYTSITLSKLEAEKVIKVLTEHFKLGAVK